MPFNAKNSRRRSLLIVLFLLVVGVAGWQQRFNIYDWWRLRNYEPPAEIAQLAQDISLTDHGRKLFYVNRPALNDEVTFQQNCTIGEATIVLGCYVSGRGIFLFKVTDERLQGVHQVTAAHELLHAAYERLSGSERQRIDELTNSAYFTLANDRIKNTVATYEARDSSVVPNELHSILATEVESLPQELEDYYRQYFADRQTVVSYSKAYEAAFQERQEKIADYDRQLSGLKARIDALETELDNQEADLASERRTLDQLLAQNRTDEYNSRVPGYNSKIRAYNTNVNEVRNLIDRYNRLVAERNEIAVEENQLIEAIDSRPDTIPTE